MSHKNVLGRVVLTCTIAGGLLLAVGTAPAGAARNDEQDCHSRVEKAQLDVDRDASRHGQSSHQVAADLRRLDSAREWCAKHHADWDHGSDRDYDRYRDVKQR